MFRYGPSVLQAKPPERESYFVMGKVRVNSSTGHLSLNAPSGRPGDLPFSFGREPKRLTFAVATSAAVDVALAVLFIIASRHHPAGPTAALQREESRMPLKDIVWLSQPGPSGGGGGGGNRMKDPPRHVELPGKDRLTVPTAKPAAIEAGQVRNEPPPIVPLIIPAKALASAQDSLPGAFDVPALATLSQGSGSGDGAETGRGPGIGSGTGPGLGPGRDGGTGGRSYQPSNGVTTPVLLREVKPSYTSDAMRAKVQGSVLLECVVRPDGSVGDVRVVRSLDAMFGLDLEAMKAARQWRFRPALRLGESVPVLITIQLDFTLR
jgi:protein TonB